MSTQRLILISLKTAIGVATMNMAGYSRNFEAHCDQSLVAIVESSFYRILKASYMMTHAGHIVVT